MKMTTTSTFQGMNTDSKPSSRVSNPPGGASSNIFGYDDNAAPQRTPIKNNPNNINRSNNDIFHQSGNPQLGSTPHVRSTTDVNRGASDIFNQGTGVSAAQLPKSRAPRSAYNPITGEAYEQSNSKKEQVAYDGGSQLKSDEPHVDVASCEVKPESLAEVQIQGEGNKIENRDSNPNQASHESSDGVFGTGTTSQEHRSTRVSQPPGGRSTKLW